MKTKEEIVANWLPRYTKRNLEDFEEYILLTNYGLWPRQGQAGSYYRWL